MSDDGSNLTLRTEIDGLLLRRLSAGDAAEIGKLRRANIEYHGRFNIGHPPSEEDEVVAWLAGSIQLDFGIWLCDRLVGICELGFWRASDSGLEPVPVSAPGALVAGIGYVIDEAHANRGFGTSAVRAMLDYARSLESVTHLRVPVMTANVASRRVLEKCGFRLVTAGDDWCVYELRS